MGVDLERIRPVRDLTRLARRVFSDLEQEELIAINDQAEKERAFFRGWTRKEAVLKALGTGFSFSPRRLHVGLMEANVLSCQLDSVETLQVHSGMISNNLFWSVAIPSVTNSLSKFRLLGKDRDSLD
jgi:4'-phosphopantetheinyl transferase